MPREDGVEHRGGGAVAGAEIGVEANDDGEALVRGSPVGWGRRKRAGGLVGCPSREDGVDLGAKRRGFHREDLGDEREVDEVLDAGAGASAFVRPGVGVQLLGNLGGEGQRGHSDPRDAGEAEEVRSGEQVLAGKRTLLGPDVQDEGFERPSRQRCGDPEAVGAAQKVRSGVGSFEAEHEVVVKVTARRVEEGVERVVLLGTPGEVDVLGGPGAVG